MVTPTLSVMTYAKLPFHLISLVLVQLRHISTIIFTSENMYNPNRTIPPRITKLRYIETFFLEFQSHVRDWLPNTLLFVAFFFCLFNFFPVRCVFWIFPFCIRFQKAFTLCSLFNNPSLIILS